MLVRIRYGFWTVQQLEMGGDRVRGGKSYINLRGIVRTDFRGASMRLVVDASWW